MAQHEFRVLFLCTGNSARSILAEAVFNHLAPPGWTAISAGSKPTGEVHPRSLAVLARERISAEGCYSKSWESFSFAPDIVITVCSSAAAEACPVYLQAPQQSRRRKRMGVACPEAAPALGRTAAPSRGLRPLLRSHWGVEDPARAKGNEREVDAAFTAAYRVLRKRIEAFFALPLNELRHDPVRLKAELDRIGAEVS